MENDKVIDANDRQEIENLWLQKILKVFAIRSSGGVYNGVRWAQRVDKKNPRPLLVHTGNLLQSLRNAEVQWDGNMHFDATVEQRGYKGKNVSTREVFLYHQLGTPTMPPRPMITDLEKNDIEDIRQFVDRKTQRKEERFYKRWYDSFIKLATFFWR